MDKTIDYITGSLEALRGDYICVSNVHTTVMAFRDEEYRTVQNSAAMALPDGQPLSIVSRRRGYAQARRVPGPDLMPAILDLSQKKGYTHYFYGSTKSTLEQLTKAILLKYPKVEIAGMYAPPFRELTEEEDAEVVRRINDSGADFIWVALGAPKQEKWMYEHRGRVGGLYCRHCEACADVDAEVLSGMGLPHYAGSETHGSALSEHELCFFILCA